MAKQNDGNLSGYNAPAIHKATQILRVVSEEKTGIGVSKLSKVLGYSKSTVFGLTKSMVNEGLLRQSPEGKKYFLGVTLFELAMMDWNAIKVNMDVQPFLDSLRDTLQETVCLGTISRDKAMIMATAEALKPLRISATAGSTIPLLPGAVGKVILSTYELERAREIIDEIGLKSYTLNSITSAERYLKTLEQARKLGYAVDDEEYIQGVRAVAVCLNTVKGLPMAVWAVGFSSAMEFDKIPDIATEIAHISDQISHHLNQWM